MKNVLLASVAVAIFGLAGCAHHDDKMMKDDGMAKDDAMMKDDTMAKDDAMMKDDTMAAGDGSDAMMDLCLGKGGSVGSWAGEGDSTKTCDMADGSSYPLAQLTAFEAFQ